MKKSFAFLREIAENNNKEWFEENKPTFREAQAEFAEFIGLLLPKAKIIDKTLTSLEPKDVIYRIYRDVRFSKDKTPYKNNFAAQFARSGRKSDTPCYYLHIEPNNSFIAAGVWMPLPPILKKIREEVDYNGDLLLEILNEPIFKDNFSEIVGERLRTIPKGFSKDHIHTDLLQLKSYIVEKKFTDEEVLAPNFVEVCENYIQIMQPFNQWLYLAFD